VESPLRSATIRQRGYSWEKEQETDVPEPDTVPVVRIPNIQERLDLRDLLYLRRVSSQDLAAFSVRRDWVLFVASNGNPDRIGDSVLIEADEVMLFASFLQGITTRNSMRLIPAFLARWLQLDTVHQTFSKTSQQTTGLANFSWSAVKNLPIRYPADVGEQRRIDAAICAVDRAIGQVEEEFAACRSVRTALVQRLFERPSSATSVAGRETKIGVLPKAWDVRPMRELLAEPPSAGTSPAVARSEPPGTPTLNVACIQHGRCTTDARTYIDVPEEVLAHYQVSRGDFFVIRGNGNVELVATGGLMGEEPVERTIYSDLLIRLRFNTTMEPGFMPWLWSSTKFVRRLQAKAKTGSGLWKIGQRDIYHHLVPVPPKDEQRSMVRALDSVESAATAIRGRATELKRFRRAFLRNLLTGRIRLSEKAST
jgi:type I restriction enzyme S subunit